MVLSQKKLLTLTIDRCVFLLWFFKPTITLVVIHSCET